MNWVIAAYTVFWVAIFGYVVLLSRKQKDLARRLDELKSVLEQTDQND